MCVCVFFCFAFYLSPLLLVLRLIGFHISNMQPPLGTAINVSRMVSNCVKDRLSFSVSECACVCVCTQLHIYAVACASVHSKDERKTSFFTTQPTACISPCMNSAKLQSPFLMLQIIK